MALSEHEQRLLDEMERSLYHNDADVMSTSRTGEFKISPRAIILAILAVAVGIAVVVVSMAMQQPLFGLLGFVIMVGGIYLTFKSPKRSGEQGSVNAEPDTHPRTKTPTSGKNSGFMDRMEDRWNRRNDGQI